MTTQTFICIRWGALYGSEYVNTLYGMIARNTRRPMRLVCYTDDPAGVRPEVECHPLPPIDLPPTHMWKPWRKVSLWAKSLEGLTDRALFIDLDVVITGDMDGFFDYAPEADFVVAENWTQKGKDIGNTSVYRFDVGSHVEIYDRLMRDPAAVVNAYPNSQTYISRMIGPKTYWPAPWCVSFKHTLMPRWPLNFVKPVELPADARVVCFTGQPNPDDARDGRWPARGLKKLYKHVRPTPWIAEHWRG
ncbi:hypothetical protein GCM10008171_10760 [Methylopila jiangsuensis]|uniref:Glycosyltransferase n=1 Tax=Methylopila jiangsuensis TaxID=586230 RepID=A0A9W6N390_9HYPH|nr:hypothetical protein [Methylopila jiangsuensis]MDR6286064.1 hypothetical protein [Methylopila jiangsuensis]GLK75822.1 hypothetical protein GCM10008171_10760 [Methylopila jiangsuensis]